MFTGIIATTGSIARIQVVNGDWRLTVRSDALDLTGVQLGDSIAVSGVCLTAVQLGEHSFSADVSRETLAVTTLQHWREGDLVNLELALQPQSRLGGHIVSGHVDGIGELVSRATLRRRARYVLMASALQSTPLTAMNSASTSFRTRLSAPRCICSNRAAK